MGADADGVPDPLPWSADDAVAAAAAEPDPVSIRVGRGEVRGGDGGVEGKRTNEGKMSNRRSGETFPRHLPSFPLPLQRTLTLPLRGDAIMQRL
jgi:hypothetical protein